MADSNRGFSFITPSHNEIPSFIDWFVKIVNGILTRWRIIEQYSALALQSRAAARRRISRKSLLEAKLVLEV